MFESDALAFVEYFINPKTVPAYAGSSAFIELITDAGLLLVTDEGLYLTNDNPSTTNIP